MDPILGAIATTLIGKVLGGEEMPTYQQPTPQQVQTPMQLALNDMMEQIAKKGNTYANTFEGQLGKNQAYFDQKNLEGELAKLAQNKSGTSKTGPSFNKNITPILKEKTTLLNDYKSLKDKMTNAKSGLEYYEASQKLQPLQQKIYDNKERLEHVVKQTPGYENLAGDDIEMMFATPDEMKEKIAGLKQNVVGRQGEDKQQYLDLITKYENLLPNQEKLFNSLSKSSEEFESTFNEVLNINPFQKEINELATKYKMTPEEVNKLYQDKVVANRRPMTQTSTAQTPIEGSVARSTLTPEEIAKLSPEQQHLHKMHQTYLSNQVFSDKQLEDPYKAQPLPAGQTQNVAQQVANTQAAIQNTGDPNALPYTNPDFLRPVLPTDYAGQLQLPTSPEEDAIKKLILTQATESFNQPELQGAINQISQSLGQVSPYTQQLGQLGQPAAINNQGITDIANRLSNQAGTMGGTTQYMNQGGNIAAQLQALAGQINPQAVGTQNLQTLAGQINPQAVGTQDLQTLAGQINPQAVGTQDLQGIMGQMGNLAKQSGMSDAEMMRMAAGQISQLAGQQMANPNQYESEISNILSGRAKQGVDAGYEKALYEGSVDPLRRELARIQQQNQQSLAQRGLGQSTIVENVNENPQREFLAQAADLANKAKVQATQFNDQAIQNALAQQAALQQGLTTRQMSDAERRAGAYGQVSGIGQALTELTQSDLQRQMQGLGQQAATGQNIAEIQRQNELLKLAGQNQQGGLFKDIAGIQQQNEATKLQGQQQQGGLFRDIAGIQQQNEATKLQGQQQQAGVLGQSADINKALEALQQGRVAQGIDMSKTAIGGLTEAENLRQQELNRQAQTLSTAANLGINQQGQMTNLAGTLADLVQMKTNLPQQMIMMGKEFLDTQEARRLQNIQLPYAEAQNRNANYWKYQGLPMDIYAGQNSLVNAAANIGQNIYGANVQNAQASNANMGGLIGSIGSYLTQPKQKTTVTPTSYGNTSGTGTSSTLTNMWNNVKNNWF